MKNGFARIFCVLFALLFNRCLCLSAEAKPNQGDAEKSLRHELYIQCRSEPFPAALEAINKLIVLDRAGYIGIRGDIYKKHGDFQNALIDYNEAIIDDPNTWLLRRAFLFSKQRRYPEALDDCNRLLSSAEKELKSGWDDSSREGALRQVAHVYCRRAPILHESGQKEQALADYRHAAYLDQRRFAEYAAYSSELGSNEDYVVAVQRLALSEPDVYFSCLGRYYEKRGEVNEALKNFNDAVTMSSKIGFKDGYSPRAWAPKARQEFYIHQKNYELAARDKELFEKTERLQRHIAGFSTWPTGIEWKH